MRHIVPDDYPENMARLSTDSVGNITGEENQPSCSYSFAKFVLRKLIDNGSSSTPQPGGVELNNLSSFIWQMMQQQKKREQRSITE